MVTGVDTRQHLAGGSLTGACPWSTISRETANLTPETSLLIAFQRRSLCSADRGWLDQAELCRVNSRAMEGTNRPLTWRDTCIQQLSVLCA